MTVDTPPPTPSDKDDKKEHRPPQGATHKVSWTDDAGRFADIDVISEWIVLRKKERPAAEVFHTYYRLAGPQGQSNRRRPVSFVFNGGPGASSAYLHVGGLSPRRVLFKPDGGLEPPPVRLVNNPESWIAFTDQVSHAAMAGQYQLEQTFLLPVDAMRSPEQSPLRILERLMGRSLI